MWLSPFSFVQGQDANLYVYALNRPTDLIDPTGEFGIPGCIAGAIGGGLGGLLVGDGNDRVLNVALGLTGGCLGGLVSPPGITAGFGAFYGAAGAIASGQNKTGVFAATFGGGLFAGIGGLGPSGIGGLTNLGFQGLHAAIAAGIFGEIGTELQDQITDIVISHGHDPP